MSTPESPAKTWGRLDLVDKKAATKRAFVNGEFQKHTAAYLEFLLACTQRNDPEHFSSSTYMKELTGLEESDELTYLRHGSVVAFALLDDLNDKECQLPAGAYKQYWNNETIDAEEVYSKEVANAIDELRKHSFDAAVYEADCVDVDLDNNSLIKTIAETLGLSKRQADMLYTGFTITYIQGTGYIHTASEVSAENEASMIWQDAASDDIEARLDLWQMEIEINEAKELKTSFIDINHAKLADEVDTDAFTHSSVDEYFTRLYSTHDALHGESFELAISMLDILFADDGSVGVGEAAKMGAALGFEAITKIAQQRKVEQYYRIVWTELDEHEAVYHGEEVDVPEIIQGTVYVAEKASVVDREWRLTVGKLIQTYCNNNEEARALETAFTYIYVTGLDAVLIAANGSENN